MGVAEETLPEVLEAVKNVKFESITSSVIYFIISLLLWLPV